VLHKPLLASQALVDQLSDDSGLRIGPAQQIALKGMESLFSVRPIEASHLPQITG
jgi:hypothetical protein